MAIETLAQREHAALRLGRERARVAVVSNIGLAIPTSYMNESGDPVARLCRRFDGPLVVVHDDLDLDLGRIKLKIGGGSGGHRGIDSIVSRLGTREFMRIRIGIGRPPGSMDPAVFVLRKFRKPEFDLAAEAVERAADSIVEIARDGIEAAMNTFN